MLMLAIVAAGALAVGYLTGEQTAYRSLGYGSERAFSSLSPYWLARAWFGR